MRPATTTRTHDASQATQESLKVDLVHDALGRLEEVRSPEVPGRERFAVKNSGAAPGELVRRDDATDPLAPSVLRQVDARAWPQGAGLGRYGREPPVSNARSRRLTPVWTVHYPWPLP